MGEGWEISFVHEHLKPSTDTFKRYTTRQKVRVRENILREYRLVSTFHRRGVRSRATTTTTYLGKCLRPTTYRFPGTTAI